MVGDSIPYFFRSIRNQSLQKNMVPSAVKMGLYGLCPALHLLHLLAKSNSRHVAMALKGFTSKFNPKMRVVGICVGSECRLAKNKKRPQRTQTDVMMGKMLDGCTHTHYVFILFLQFSFIGGNRLQFFGPKTFISDSIRPKHANTKLNPIINC